MDSETAVLASGRILQVSVSPGGVPKLPVERAWVGVLGLEGDAHRENTVHGGPHQAVCLYGIEAIERLQSEGHPVEPGSVGENLTTSGIEWSLLPVGARARVGEELELEVASATNPCKTQIRNFTDGRFSRISIDLHPADSRMYARVLREGEVKPGDLISVTSAPEDSRAADELLLKRLDRVESKSMIAAWRAAKGGGYEIDIVESGDIPMASAPTMDGPAFNHASGLARYPNLLEMVKAFYDRHEAAGWLWLEDTPWEGAEPEVTVNVFAAHPLVVPDAPGPAGLTVRIIGPDEAAAYSGVHGTTAVASGQISPDQPNPWHVVYERLAKWPHRWLFLAELGGKPVGAASLHVHARAGWLRGASVAVEAQGRGIQRSLIAARVRHAMDQGCDLVGSWAETEGPSSTNLQRMGFRTIGSRSQFKYVPRTVGN